MPLISAAQFPGLAPDPSRLGTGFAQGQKMAALSQQSNIQANEARLNTAIQTAAQLSATPSLEGKMAFLRSNPSEDNDELLEFFSTGQTGKANEAVDAMVKVGQEMGVLKAPAAGPAPTIREGIGPGGQPGVFAVTPQGATPIPGITPAQKTPLVTIGGDVGEEQKAIAKVQAQRFSDVMSEGRNAESSLETLDQLDAIDIKTGALEPLKASLAAVAEGFGVDASGLADVATAQALGAVSNRMVNDVLNAAKGPQTEGDALRAKKTIRSLGDDPLAGQFKSDSLRALALRKVEQADFIGEEISNGKTFTAADKAWREFKKKTPNLSEVIKNPETGLPIFFYQFKENAKRVREGITDEEIIKAWRQAHAK